MSGLVTGTSSEYLGTRPLRRIFRERPVTFVLGPRGVGKTAVALRLAQAMAPTHVVLDAAKLNDELVRCVRRKAWSDAILGAAVLILDGPEKIAQRPASREFVHRLLEARIAANLKTVICEAAHDSSVSVLMDCVPSGSAAVLGLRLPLSRSGRLRVARRMCDELGLERSESASTDLIEPWGYAAVDEALRAKLAAS